MNCGPDESVDRGRSVRSLGEVEQILMTFFGEEGRNPLDFGGGVDFSSCLGYQPIDLTTVCNILSYQMLLKYYTTEKRVMITQTDKQYQLLYLEDLRQSICLAEVDLPAMGLT